MARNELILSQEVLAEWREERKRKSVELERAQQEFLQLNQRIQAAETLLQGLGYSISNPVDLSFLDDDAPTGKANGAAHGDENMTAVIETLANGHSAPFSHDQMRQKLRARGFPEDRLGNYYYTAVHRLKNKGRIAVGEVDKKIGPVPR